MTAHQIHDAQSGGVFRDFLPVLPVCPARDLLPPPPPTQTHVGLVVILVVALLGRTL